MNKNLSISDRTYNDKESYYGGKRLSLFSCFAVSGSLLINLAIVVYAIITSVF